MHRLLPLLLAFFSAVALAAGAPAATLSQATKDPQAVAILTQCLTAAGGATAIGNVQDLTATGTITYNWAGQSVQGTVTLYGKGFGKYRMDSSLPAGIQSSVVNADGGRLTAPTGQITSVPFYRLMTAGSLTLPAARVANALSDPSTAVSYLGLVAWQTQQAHHVRVIPPVDPSLASIPQFQGLGTFDLYIDPTTYQLLELAETISSGDVVSQTCLHEIIFSSYTATNNMSVPFGIQEMIGGQQTWSIALSSITFNTGLSDTLFNF